MDTTSVRQSTSEKTKTYTYEETMQASVKYFGGDELAANVWINKYALKDSFGNIYEKTPDDMHRRIASEIARVEQRYPNPKTEQEIYDLRFNTKLISNWLFNLCRQYFILLHKLL